MCCVIEKYQHTGSTQISLHG